MSEFTGAIARTAAIPVRTEGAAKWAGALPGCPFRDTLEPSLGARSVVPDN